MKAFAEADRAKDMHGPNVAGPKATGTKYWSEIWIRLVCSPTRMPCRASPCGVLAISCQCMDLSSPCFTLIRHGGIVILLENLFRDYFCFL